jgi:hypothetical protein
MHRLMIARTVPQFLQLIPAFEFRETAIADIAAQPFSFIVRSNLDIYWRVVWLPLLPPVGMKARRWRCCCDAQNADCPFHIVG